MALADAIKAEATAKKGPPCTMRLLIATLTPADAKALADAMDAGMAGAAIARALASEGHRLSADTVNRHRNGDCMCGR